MSAEIGDAAVAIAGEELPATQKKLEELTKAAELQYSLKNYSTAADLYGDATTIQAKLNGEMAPRNADLLFYYGRALYKVALAKSDVLGGKVAQEEKKKPKAEKQPKKAPAESPSAATAGAKQETTEPKPFFQLDGPGNWSDSDDEDVDDEDDEGDADEQDDLQDAYEVFELARVMYGKQLEIAAESDSAEDAKGKCKAELTPEQLKIKEKIADCHGFLAEISMENERFHDAIEDARKSLALQEELHPLEHEAVSEAHFVLSLALEFASKHKIREDLQPGAAANGEKGPAPHEGTEEQEIDLEMRKEAAKHIELILQGLDSRLAREKAALENAKLSPEARKVKENIIKDKSEVRKDMQARLAELKEDPKSQDFDSIDQSVFQGMIQGLLDPAAQKAKLAEASKTANDLSGLVRTKKKEKPAPATSAVENGKRRLEPIEESNDKRAKLDVTEESNGN